MIRSALNYKRGCYYVLATYVKPNLDINLDFFSTKSETTMHFFQGFQFYKIFSETLGKAYLTSIAPFPR